MEYGVSRVQNKLTAEERGYLKTFGVSAREHVQYSRKLGRTLSLMLCCICLFSLSPCGKAALYAVALGQL